MNRFAAFFFEDQAVRWRVYGTSSGVAFIYALVNLLILHREDKSVGMETVGILLILISLSIAVYVTRVRISEEATTRPLKISSARLRIVSAFATALIAFAYFTGIPRIQAAIMDFRLERFTASSTVYAAYQPPDQQLQNHVRTINSVVDTSSRNQIPVDPNLLVKARTVLLTDLSAPTLSAQTKQAGWTAAIDLESFAYTRQAQTGAITTVTPRDISTGDSYFFNGVTPIDNKSIYVKGDHSVFTVRGQFFINQSIVIFDSIDFVGSMSQDIFVVRGDSSRVFVRDSIIKNVIQNLDHITWVDVQFENSQLLYRGGPLRLRNVTFTNCDLSKLDFSLGILLKNPALVASITKASGQPVNFNYEP
jgi:hypothetical protein